MGKPANPGNYFQNFGNFQTDLASRNESRFENEPNSNSRRYENEPSFNPQTNNLASGPHLSVHQRLGVKNPQSNFGTNNSTAFAPGSQQSSGLLDRPLLPHLREDIFPQPGSQIQRINPLLSGGNPLLSGVSPLLSGISPVHAGEQDLRHFLRSEQNLPNLDPRQAYDTQLNPTQDEDRMYGQQSISDARNFARDGHDVRNFVRDGGNDAVNFARGDGHDARNFSIEQPDHFDSAKKTDSETSLMRAEIMMRRILNNLDAGSSSSSRIVSNISELGIALNLSKVLAQDIRCFIRENEKDDDVRDLIRKDAEEKKKAAELGAAAEERAYPGSGLKREEEAATRFLPNPGIFLMQVNLRKYLYQ